MGTGLIGMNFPFSHPTISATLFLLVSWVMRVESYRQINKERIAYKFLSWSGQLIEQQQEGLNSTRSKAP